MDDDTQQIREMVFNGLTELECMLPDGPDDMIVPADVQERMKDKLYDIINRLE